MAGHRRTASAEEKWSRVAGNGPRVLLVDSVSLEENDTLYLGSPGTSLVVGPDGMVYVPDMSRDQVLRYAPDGSLQGVVGQRGDGPGELRGVGVALDVADSTLVVRGYQNFRMSVFHALTGAFRGSVTYSGYMTWVGIHGDTAWYATRTPGTGKMFGAFPLNALALINHPLIEGKIIDIPWEYREYAGLDIADNAHLALVGDTIVAGFAALDYLIMARKDGTTLDTLFLPARQRRGAPPAVLARVYRPRSGPPSTVFTAVSFLAGIWRLRDGTILVQHRDLQLEGTERNAPITGTAWLSLISADLTRACLDGELPYPEPAYPVIDIQNDTVYALDQMLQPAPATGTRTVVRKFVVDSEGCDWFPITRSH